jgi:hypothetical protein
MPSKQSSPYVPLLLAPHSFGSVHCVAGDFDAWCEHLANKGGVPVFVIRSFFTLCLGASTHAGLVITNQILAAFTIGLGLYIPEEWPDLGNWAIASSSINEFWGRRWHQSVRVSHTANMLSY